MHLFWTALWFVINTGFVAALIVYLFMHRSVTIARLQSVPAERLRTLTARRNITGIISIVMFVGMCASFVINMKING